MDSKRAKAPAVGKPIGPCVLIIEDHPLVAKAVIALFTSQQDFPEVFVENSLDLGLAKVSQHEASRPFDLVLLDLGLPGHSGLSAFWSFREECPSVPVAVFSGEDSPQLMRQLLKGGAKGFIPKSMDPDQMIGAIRLIMAGGVFVPMETLENDFPRTESSDSDSSTVIAARSLADAPSQNHEVKSIDPIMEIILAMPPRRRDVLRLMAEGYSNKEICRAHDVTMNTVKTHVTLIFSTLMLSSRQELMMLLVQHDLLPKLKAQLGSEGHPDSDLSKKGLPNAPRHSAWPLQ